MAALFSQLYHHHEHILATGRQRYHFCHHHHSSPETTSTTTTTTTAGPSTMRPPNQQICCHCHRNANFTNPIVAEAGLPSSSSLLPIQISVPTLITPHHNRQSPPQCLPPTATWMPSAPTSNATITRCTTQSNSILQN